MPHVAESAGQVRHRLVDDLTRHGVAGDVVDNAALLASELVGNAVRYAHPLPGDVLTVRWEMHAGLLMLRVTDGGGRHAPHMQEAGPQDTRGRGLAIVDALATRWGFERGRDGVGKLNTVWVELPLGSPADHPGGLPAGVGV